MFTKLALTAALVLAILPPALADDDAPPPAPPDTEDVIDRLKDRDAGLRLSGAIDAREVQDKAITPLLLKLTKDKDHRVRMAAIDALRTRVAETEKKKAAQSLSGRLSYLAERPADADEYLLVISALHDLAQPIAVESLLDMDLDEPRESAKERFLAVGNTPCAAAIEELIQFVAKGRKRGRNHQRQFAVEALRYATGEKLGQDPDRWRGWWRDVKASFDFGAAAAMRAEDREKKEEKERRREEKIRKREERERKKRERGEDDGQG